MARWKFIDATRSAPQYNHLHDAVAVAVADVVVVELVVTTVVELVV